MRITKIQARRLPPVSIGKRVDFSRQNGFEPKGAQVKRQCSLRQDLSGIDNWAVLSISPWESKKSLLLLFSRWSAQLFFPSPRARLGTSSEILLFALPSPDGTGRRLRAWRGAWKQDKRMEKVAADNAEYERTYIDPTSNGPTDFTPLCHLRRHSPLRQGFFPSQQIQYILHLTLKLFKSTSLARSFFHFSCPRFPCQCISFHQIQTWSSMGNPCVVTQWPANQELIN